MVARREWCNRCQVEWGYTLVTYREIYSQTPKWAQPNGTEWAQTVCADCLGELNEMETRGDIWSLTVRR